MKHYTLKRCVLKLNNVRILRQGDDVQLLKAITAEQREMLQLCNVNIDGLCDIARNVLLSSSTKKHNY